jgi:hypothetical protein
VSSVRIRLVLSRENAGWVIEKMALKLEAELAKLGCDVDIRDSPCDTAAINHFMSYNFVEASHARSTAMITHLDDLHKLRHVVRLLRSETLDTAICLSPNMAKSLIAAGAPVERIRWVLPATDALLQPRRTRIGLSGRIYADGRKNENWLINVASQISLEAFTFVICGNGWEEVATALKAAGATVELVPETSDFIHDYQRVIDHLHDLDWWMYLGLDEGSLGSLDAALAGIPLIATPQGFHLNLPNGIKHGVLSAQQLRSVLLSLSLPYETARSARDYWTWARYAAEHLAIWQGEPPPDIASTCMTPNRDLSILGANRAVMIRRSLRPRRIMSAIGRSRMGLRLRRLAKNTPFF